jgi:methyltransferase-like protein/cyclopropane fatty-acyl-phospholipid synthase-like methyltransferase
MSETTAAADSVRDYYDRVPYLGGSHHHTHPDHLATLALLNGLEPAPPQRCCVLELGCADGGNVIAFAHELPESTFVGIDLSPRQIERGLEEVQALGLKNVELRAMSIMDVDASFGAFDYILCHGVYSWVEEPVQEKILAICGALLAPHGVAYISYNTFPGWHLRRMLREMLLHHTRNVEEPEEKVARSFELVQFLVEAAGEGDDPHAKYLRAALEHFEEYRDRPSYILHEYLEETNAPMYFREFAARAAAHGLQYAGEAEAHEAEVDNLSPQVAQKLRSFAHDRIELEQYLDFVLNRTFRRSLLVRSGVPLDRTMQPERMQRLCAATACKPVSDDADLRPDVSEAFRTERDKTFSSTHPVAKATLVELAARWPRALSFEEVVNGVNARLTAAGGSPDDTELVIPDLLYSLFWSGVVTLHLAPPYCVETVSEFPRTAELARRQAEAGLLVTNQRRRVLKLDDPMARFVLLQLDGTRDRAALVRQLDREVAAGRLDIRVDEQPITEPERIPRVLDALLDHHLRKMAQLALLVG